ncbi:S1C family serine protease [Pseudofulvibacter geojedonensis]|uniref:S1C family serine protease n=1 Tax=Pseudofulvibacter geojedonensis TaxID=1123758 RepID=A0ABW3HZR1_9FLAO
MKNIAKIVLFSMLGGAITLSSYKLFLEPDVKEITVYKEPSTRTFTTPVVNNTANLDALSNIDLTQAAEKTVNSVVHVTNTATYIQPRSLFDYYNNRGEQIEKGSTGSGVIITPDGYIVTNNHVIDNADKLTVKLNNQKTYQARVVGTDKKHDIAVIKIETDEDLPYIPFGNSDNVKIGEWALAVGNPYNLTSTVTAGIISAKARDLDGDRNIQSYIQTDAAVNPGNSGGALVNTRGELIGINTAISSRTGSYIGYAFAVPSNITRKIVEDLMEFGTVQQGILGVSGNGLNAEFAKHYEVNETEGYFIASVDEKSGAAKAGLKKGDIIKKMDHVIIKKSSDLTGFLSSKNPNNIVNVTIYRNGKLKTIPVKLSDKSILTSTAFGLELKNLTQTEKENYDISSGIRVIEVIDSRLKKNLRITKDCVITKFNEKSIESIDDLNELKSLEIKNLYQIEVIYPDGQMKNWWLQ